MDGCLGEVKYRTPLRWVHRKGANNIFAQYSSASELSWVCVIKVKMILMFRFVQMFRYVEMKLILRFLRTQFSGPFREPSRLLI